MLVVSIAVSSGSTFFWMGGSNHGARSLDIWGWGWMEVSRFLFEARQPWLTMMRRWRLCDLFVFCSWIRCIMSVWMSLVAALRRYVAVSFFIKSRKGRIPDSLYIMEELVSLGSHVVLCVLSKFCKAVLLMFVLLFGEMEPKYPESGNCQSVLRPQWFFNVPLYFK